jgi:hypothetical protein
VQAARLVKDGVPRSALDINTFGIHDGTNSHLDALCHYRVMRDGQWESVQRSSAGVGREGCKADGMDRFTRPDPEVWEKCAHVKIGSSDALFIHTGR